VLPLADERSVSKNGFISCQPLEPATQMSVREREEVDVGWRQIKYEKSIILLGFSRIA
jgi:hypothetical protein